MNRTLPWATTCLLLATVLTAQDNRAEQGKKIVQEALAALGGEKFLSVTDRIESGRAYSFYRDRLSGLSVAKIYTLYRERGTTKPGDLALLERQTFGKKEDVITIFSEDDAWQLTFRGAKPLARQQIDRYRESTRQNIFYILRERMQEPGLTIESQGSDIFEFQPVDKVLITDTDNRTVDVYFSKSTKLPVYQRFYRRDPVSKDRIEEVSRFSKYRDVGDGVMWPFNISRERDGNKIFEIFSETVQVNQKLPESQFRLPANTKVLPREKDQLTN